MSEDKEQGRLQWSMRYGEEIWVVRADPQETEEEFMSRVADMKTRINAAYPPDASKSAEVGGNSYQRNPVSKLDGEKSFQVEKIKLASGGDHPRWTVMGGNFTKFGVTCWPEVLENAGLKSLDPLKENVPTGSWTAFYTEKLKDGKAVPDKVVRLEKN